MSNIIAPGSSADINVQVRALATDPNVSVQYKTLILKKNLVNGVNTLTQAMISEPNTRYVVKYDFSLGAITKGDITIDTENSLLVGPKRSFVAQDYNYIVLNTSAAQDIIIDDTIPTTINNIVYYLTTVTVPAGKTLRLIDNEHCVLFSDNSTYYNNLFHITAGEEDLTLIIGSLTTGTYEDAYEIGDIYYYEDVDILEGQTIKLLDTTNIVFIENNSVSSNIEITSQSDTTVRIASRTIGTYQDCYQKGYYNYYASVTVPAGKKLNLLDTRNCILLNGTHTDRLFADFYVASENTILYIASKTSGTYDNIYQLRDSSIPSITIPNNCILEFEGGSISHGEIIGTNTRIYASEVSIFNDITISGTWICPYITSTWFKDAQLRDNVIKELINLSSIDIQNEIVINKGDYWVAALSDSTIVKIKANTRFVLLGNIRLRPNNFNQAAILDANSTIGNIFITGGGYIYGDKDEHIYVGNNTGEKNHGIRVYSNNVTIDGINIKDVTGDGIDVVQAKTEYKSTNVIIRNFIIDGSRRQGISLGGVNCIVENGIIRNVNGTLPGAAFDIESSDSTSGATELVRQVIRNISIDNCIRGIQWYRGVDITVGRTIVQNVYMTNVAVGFNQTSRCHDISLINCNVTVKPGYEISVSRGGIKYKDGIKYLLNQFLGRANISGCLFNVSDDVPEKAIMSSYRLMECRDAGRTNNVKITGNTLSSPNFICISPSYGSIISQNNINTYKPFPGTTVEGVTVNNNNISCQNITYKGIKYTTSLYTQGYSFISNSISAQCPISGYITSFIDNNISLDLTSYPFANASYAIIHNYDRLTVDKNIIDISAAVDYLVKNLKSSGYTSNRNIILSNIFNRNPTLSEVEDSCYMLTFAHNIVGTKKLPSYIKANRHQLNSNVSCKSGCLIANQDGASYQISSTKKDGGIPSHSISSPLYYYKGAEKDNGGTLSYSDLIIEGIINFKNLIPDAADLIPNSPVYFIITMTESAKNFKLPTGYTNRYTQELPETDESGVAGFIYLGIAISKTHINLNFTDTKIYSFVDGILTRESI